MGLTDKEKEILKICDEEPGTVEKLKKEIKNKYSNEEIKKILVTLEKQGLIYVDKEGFWSSTLEGSKKL
jgi:fructose-1-phosphate kinase PfkB-like protein